MKFDTKFWLRISLFNLLIVAFFGTVMRYKIGFEFPHFDQKHLQHAHSHFAFIGWITHTLFVLMIGILQRDALSINVAHYKKLIIINLICSYGMLISFSIQGYGAFSIGFLTFSVLISYLFAYRFFRDLKNVGHRPYTNWFTAALWLNIISSLGTFTLAFMMASHNFDQNIHLASLYFYLHFQYNGFFMFVCMGLFLTQIYQLNPEYKQHSRIFWMFFLSCIPAYFLSILWAKIPLWLYSLVLVAAIIQLVAWIDFLISLKKSIISKDTFFRSGRYLFLIIAMAVSVKLVLQLGSTIPAVSKLAFGFRPIIIAYLHLILLAIISVFLVSYFYIYKLIQINRLTTVALVLFVVGVYLNEIVLGIQGIASFSYTVVPKANEMLFGIAVLILTSLVLLFLSQQRNLFSKRTG